MKKIRLVLIAFLLSLTFVGMNLGRWVDATQKPAVSDIVVCLGGGTIERVKKSIELLENGFVSKHLFLLIGESWYNQPYIRQNYPDLNVVIDEHPKNTIQEVLFIKKYMREHGYESALIVTDPPHTRRARLLLSLLSVQGDKNMKFRLVGADVGWWDKERYYGNGRAVKAVMHETGGIIYSLVLYDFIKPVRHYIDRDGGN